MARIFTTALTAVTMVAIGIVMLQYKLDELNTAGLSGPDAEALNLTREVSTETMVITGNALPRLLLIVIIVAVIMYLLLIR